MGIDDPYVKKPAFWGVLGFASCRRYLKQVSLEALLCALHVRASVASPAETEINIGLGNHK